MRLKNKGLVPLKELVADARMLAETRTETRVARIWPLLVGPVLVHHTRLISVRQRTLVLGCWQTEVITSLRQSAEATWPQVQARLERLLGLQLLRLEIVPCDPPEPRAEKLPVADHLESVLRKYRSLHKQGWTPKPK